MSTDLDFSKGRIRAYDDQPVYAQGRTKVVGIKFPGLESFEIKVFHDGVGNEQDKADAIAAFIRDAGPKIARLEMDIMTARSERNSAQRSLEHLTTGRVTFTHGPFDLRPDPQNDGLDIWRGAVWLLDPEKGFNGFGISYQSLAQLWRDMPDLRPVGTGSDAVGPFIRLASQPIKAPDEKAPHASPRSR